MAHSGVGGYFMHARSGLETEYLEQPWFDSVQTGIEEGQAVGLTPWIYDEEGWPSGFAGGKVTGRRSTAICKFLGDISYPIYITHYPLVYVYTAWVCDTGAGIKDGFPYMILVFSGAIALAYASLKCYDMPVRRWLTERFLKRA